MVLKGAEALVLSLTLLLPVVVPVASTRAATERREEEMESLAVVRLAELRSGGWIRVRIVAKEIRPKARKLEMGKESFLGFFCI